jgi:UDP-N-acetylglucosamine 1-carboxyvinyltransferase
MPSFQIQGGHRIAGAYKVQGAKNSALPILAAAVATKAKCVLHNCPQLTDVDAALQIARHLGCTALRDGATITLDASELCCASIPDALMREMRASIVFLGPLLAACRMAEVSAPGGCSIGARPIDLHLQGLRQLGVTVEETNCRLFCAAPRGLQGARITLDFPSVGATENLLVAAACAKGHSVLTGAAREPEIVDLAHFLNVCGAKIHGAGGSVIMIEGVTRLHGAEHHIIPDRIAAATLLGAAAVTGGEILLEDARPDHLDAVLTLLDQSGCRVRRLDTRRIECAAPRRLRGFPAVRTGPYPGFPTDAQAIFMALSAVAQGTSVIHETIFEDRMRHVHALRSMGAKIRRNAQMAVVEGVTALRGTQVEATDLRAGSALVLAGLAAEGETRAGNIHYIDRGFEQLERTLCALGAKIHRSED